MPPLLAPLVSGAVSFIVAFLMMRNTRAYAETKEQKKAREEAESKWKESRLEAEKGLREQLRTMREMLATERGERAKGELKTQGDFARVADILTRSVAIYDTFATMVETMKWHGKEIERHEASFKDIHSQLRDIERDIKAIPSNARNAK